jgi:hypothetical protein
MLDNEDALNRYHELYDNEAYQALRTVADGFYPTPILVDFMNRLTQAAIGTCHIVLGMDDHLQEACDAFSDLNSIMAIVANDFLNNKVLDYLNIFNPTDEEYLL